MTADQTDPRLGGHAAEPLALRLNDQLGAAATTASTTQQKPLTLADLERVAQMMSDMPPEPIGQWMRERGRPPEQWLLWLPSEYKEKGPAFWPSYVMFSRLIEQPVFIHRGAVFGA